MDNLGDPTSNKSRLIGDYILGPIVGSGSFAVVWRSTHRQLGIEVAVKEIDKKHLSPKVSDSLLKEISILSTINHPNIIHLFEAIQVLFFVFFFWGHFNSFVFVLYVGMCVSLNVGAFGVVDQGENLPCAGVLWRWWPSCLYSASWESFRNCC